MTQGKNPTPTFESIPERSTPVLGQTDDFGNSTDELPTVAEKAAEIFSKPTDVLSFLLCILGIIANGASIVAVATLRQKMTTHSKLIISLCSSDSLILLANLFYYIMYILSSWQACIRITVRLGTDIALIATLINLLIMALDHYGAIMKPLLYRKYMTNFLGNCVVLGIWSVSSCGVLVEICLGLGSRTEQDESLCTVIAYGNYHTEIFIIGFIFVVLIGIAFIYGRIYSRIKQVMPRRERARHHTDSGSVKALMTTMLFVGTFVLFWTPVGIFNVYMYVKSITDVAYIFRNLKQITMISDVLLMILLLNAVVDPIVYAIRLPKVNKGFVALFSLTQSSVVKETKTQRNFNRNVINTQVINRHTHIQEICNR